MMYSCRSERKGGGQDKEEGKDVNEVQSMSSQVETSNNKKNVPTPLS